MTPKNEVSLFLFNLSYTVFSNHQAKSGMHYMKHPEMKHKRESATNCM